MIEIRPARQADVPHIEELYADAGYGGGIADGDYAMVALSGGNVIAAVRLCPENGVTVLRGMQVRESFQRQGLGARLLQTCASRLDEKMSYCLPYSHLAYFYGLASFETVDATMLPEFLAVRLSSYLARGQDVIAMRRRPKAGTSS
jgi:N-acetylglutamate synthase-like GNAT family acetyltransferase